jgi:hypothetical protein
MLLTLFLTLASPTPILPPDCAVVFEALQQKMTANYAGMLLEVTGARRRAHDAEVARLRRIAAGASGDACRSILAEYVHWFDDPHLFLFEPYALDAAMTRERMAAVPKVALDEAAVRRLVEARGSRADPIEGIWYDRGMRVGVVTDPEGRPGRLVAVVLVSDSVTLPPGSVHAVLDRDADGSYHTVLRWRSLALTHPRAALYRGGTILRLAPAMWGRAWPLPAGEPDVLDPTDVRRPTLHLVAGVPVVTIPSHQFQYRSVLDALLTEHDAVLRAADRLVVDLRGNEGGSSRMSAALEPFLFEAELAPASRDFGAAVMLASPDQVRYASRSFGPDTSSFVRRLVTAMEAAPGTLVPLFDSDEPAPTEPAVTPIHGPERVALLVDHGTVSASEVLVLKARRSSRAVVVGESTAGALDYQSASIVRIHPDESRWYLGYPTITAHADLPEGGMRGTGIPPEIAVTWTPGVDPIAVALDRLR